MADILIRGMETPKDCSYCKMAYDGAWCLLSEEPNDCVEGGMMWRKCPYGGRPSWCPIVPIPEGHGRLIDADALDRAFTDLRFNSDGTLNHWGDRPGWCMHGYEVEKLIADAPTIIPAEGGTDECSEN